MTSQYAKLTDNALVELIKANDEAAFAELYHRYFTKIFNYSFQKINDRFKAQEVVQELFVTVWLRRAELQIESTSNYLYSAVKNLIISQYRKELTQQKYLTDWRIRTEESDYTTEHQVLYDDLRQQYEESLATLPDKCREVFMLSRSGKSNSEIAALLVISEKTVEQHITKALRLLKVNLKAHLNVFLLVGAMNWIN